MKIIRIFLVVLTVAASLLIPAVPVSALSLGEFFSLSYTGDFSKTTVAANEQFSVTVTGTAVCTKDFEFPYDVVSEVKTTGRIVAYPQSGGNSIVLNSGYTLDIQPAPTKAGESAEDSQTLNLKFPAGTPDGIYQITGELIRAQAKAVVWLDVTQYLPASKSMGTLTVEQAGDANGDGVVNMADVTRVLREILGLSPITSGADANQDGQINMADVTKIQKIILGIP